MNKAKGVNYGHKGSIERCKVTVLQLNQVRLWSDYVALRTVTSWAWSSLGLIPNYVVSVLSNEGGGSSSYARSSYTLHRDWTQEASEFDFAYISNIQLRLEIKISTPKFSTNAKMNRYIGMCTSLKCWFKHPLLHKHLTQGIHIRCKFCIFQEKLSNFYTFKSHYAPHGKGLCKVINNKIILWTCCAALSTLCWTEQNIQISIMPAHNHSPMTLYQLEMPAFHWQCY